MHTQTFLSLALLANHALSTSLPFRRCANATYPITDHTIPLYSPLIVFTGVFSADVTLGTQTLRAALDTGSSDAWFLTNDTNCTSFLTQQPVALERCGYSGPRFIPDATFEPIPDVNFNLSYGSSELINGPLGYTEVVFGGLTVPKQEISTATYASVGDDPVGNVSGLIGLGYPNATSAYPGTDPTKDNCLANDTSHCPVPYSPLLTTIFNDNLTEPLFAFALSRSNISGGVMTIGGIPHLDDPYVNVTDGVIATVPIEPYQNTSIFVHYSIGVDGFEYTGASPTSGKNQYIIDTGTSTNVLPSAEAEAFNALFDPPAFKNETLGGQYTVQCNATVPQLGVSIGGQMFYLNPEDLIISTPESAEFCFSGVQSTLAAFSLNLLGAAFLKNVLAVFDVGKTEMTFMSRMYYEDS